MMGHFLMRLFSVGKLLLDSELYQNSGYNQGYCMTQWYISNMPSHGS